MNEEDEIRFVCTLEGCPEQYEIFCQDLQVGYARLRWGIFSAYLWYPNFNFLFTNDEPIYRHEFESDNFKGIFDTQEEREFHLEAARKAIVWGMRQKQHT